MGESFEYRGIRENYQSISSPPTEVLGADEAHAERMSDEAMNIFKITICLFIALFFKAFYPSDYIAFTGAGTETLARLPIACAC